MHDGSALSTSVVVLAVVIGIWLNNRGLAKLETRVDKLGDRVDKLEGRFEIRFDKLERFLSAELMQVKINQALHEYRISHLEK